MTTVAKTAKIPTTNKGESKINKVVALMRRKKGASLDEMVKATGWLPHTTHAALSGLRNKGTVITRSKENGVSRYTIEKKAV